MGFSAMGRKIGINMPNSQQHEYCREVGVVFFRSKALLPQISMKHGILYLQQKL